MINAVCIAAQMKAICPAPNICRTIDRSQQRNDEGEYKLLVVAQFHINCVLLNYIVLTSPFFRVLSNKLYVEVE